MLHSSGAFHPTIVHPGAEVRVPRIEAWVALSWFRYGEPLAFVDARSEREWREAQEALPGARRLAPDDAEETLPILPRGRTAVVYCTSPGEALSTRAAQLLQARGYRDVRVLRGGLEAWQHEGGPTERVVGGRPV